MAGSFLSALPAMLVYLGFQRYLVKGLTDGHRPMTHHPHDHKEQ